MKESDWKIFKIIKDKAIENFCSEVLSDVQGFISNESQSSHNRYLVTSRYFNATDRQMSILFDGHSRSKAAIQLLFIREGNLVDEALLNGLSEELLEKTNPEKIKKIKKMGKSIK